MEAVGDAACEDEGARAESVALTCVDLDVAVAVANVVHPAARADGAAGLHEARGQRAIEAGAVDDGDLFARIFELCDAAAR